MFWEIKENAPKVLDEATAKLIRRIERLEHRFNCSEGKHEFKATYEVMYFMGYPKPDKSKPKLVCEHCNVPFTELAKLKEKGKPKK